jgi:hypothetical protein
MRAHALEASVAGVGFWARGLPGWDAARAYAADGLLPEAAPARPSPQLLAPNERRRAPETVAVALEVALAACTAAGRDPATLSSVFASTHGDLAITDYMCATLVDDPRAISPTKFHNSVHNAAAGYWTIGAGAMTPATAVSAFDASFAQGLVEAMAQLATGTEAVLLVGYDSTATGPLARTSRSEGLLGGALVLVAGPVTGAPRLRVRLGEEDARDADARHGPLSHLLTGNAMAPMLPVFELLARTAVAARLPAGAGRVLEVDLVHE